MESDNMPQEVRNAYKLLGVISTISDNELKKRYHELSKKYHPDYGQESGQMQQRINDAYGLITDYRKNKKKTVSSNTEDNSVFSDFKEKSYYENLMKEFKKLNFKKSQFCKKKRKELRNKQNKMKKGMGYNEYQKSVKNYLERIILNLNWYMDNIRGTGYSLDDFFSEIFNPIVDDNCNINKANAKVIEMIGISCFQYYRSCSTHIIFDVSKIRNEFPNIIDKEMVCLVSGEEIKYDVLEDSLIFADFDLMENFYNKLLFALFNYNGYDVVYDDENGNVLVDIFSNVRKKQAYFENNIRKK